MSGQNSLLLISEAEICTSNAGTTSATIVLSPGTEPDARDIGRDLDDLSCELGKGEPITSSTCMVEVVRELQSSFLLKIARVEVIFPFIHSIIS